MNIELLAHDHQFSDAQNAYCIARNADTMMWTPNLWSQNGVDVNLMECDIFNAYPKYWDSTAEHIIGLSFNGRLEGGNRGFQHPDGVVLMREVACEQFVQSYITGSESVLIVGSGYTADYCHMADKYDQVWTVNNFTNNGLISSLPNLRLVSLGNLVEYTDELKNYLLEKDVIIAQEPQYIKKPIGDFLDGTQHGWFVTRLTSKMGVIPRLVALAISNGFKHIATIGFDGYRQDQTDPMNSFRRDLTFESMDNYQGYDTYVREFALFLDYLYYMSHYHKFTYTNLGSSIQDGNLFTDLYDEYGDTIKSWESFA